MTTFGVVRKLSREDAIRPRDGHVLTNRWWVVDEEGLYWWSRYEKTRGFTPQCNGNPEIAKDIRASLYPDAQGEYIPLVFVGHGDEEYRYNPFKGA